MHKVLVVIEGGAVSEVITDTPGIEVLVKDFDVKELDDCEVDRDSYGDRCQYIGPMEENVNRNIVEAEFVCADVVRVKGGRS